MTAARSNAAITQSSDNLQASVVPVLLRFVACALALSALAYRYGADLAELLAPVFRAEINWLDDTYRIDRLFVDTEGADQVLRIVVGLAHCVVLPDGAHCGDPRGFANASTLVGNVTLPVVLLISAVLAWPVNRRSEYGWRAAVTAPALAILWALDVPFVLWGALWTLHVDAFAPDLFSPLLVWSQFLQSGGRLALAVLLALAVVSSARRLCARMGR